MTDALKECPFCESSAHYFFDRNLSPMENEREWAICDGCGATEPVSVWNRRSTGSVREAELERALEKIGTWAKAYPIAVFPEPDLKRAHEVLSAAGISLDAISAASMRHVITQVQEIVERALRGPGGRE